MRTEVIKADRIAEAAERILDKLKEDPATRSVSTRNNVIYFDGWDGLGASAVLRAVAQRLTAMASSDEAPAGLQFDQIIHVNCSKWESRRSLQRAVAEQLELPAPVMDMFDRQDEEDDFNGIAKGSRTEIPQVLTAMLQRIQELSRRRFLVIFHNGSTEEIDLGIFGFLLSGYYSTAKVLWTFQGRFRLYPRMKVDRALNKSSTQTGAATDVFLSAVTGKERHPHVYWSYLVQQEAADLVAAARKSNTCHGLVPGDIIFQPQQQVLQGDMLVSDADDDDGPWRAADALQREMLIDVEHWHHNLEYLPSHLVRSAESMACMPYWTSPPYEALLSPVRDMFQQFGHLGVLKLSHCTLRFSSPPFLSSNNLRILWLDHSRDDQVINKDRDPEKMEDDNICRFFQRLWVLDVCYSCCDRILSAQMIALMTQLRELNVVGAHDWDIGQLQGWLPNIRKLRVTKSTVGCTSCLENNLTLGMNKMELLEFSGNRTMQGGVAGNLSGISTSSNELETVIIVDGCVGIQKFSLRGCAKLKNLLLSGLFEDLRILDLSGTAVKTLDVSAMTAPSLDELFLNDCQKLCAILWPPEDKRKSNLQKLHIDTTWSATSLTPTKENSTEGSSATAGITTSSLSVVHGGRAPSEFDWCIRVRDARLLRSLVVPFKHKSKHVEIYSPAAAFSSSNDNKATSSNSSIKQHHVPLVKVAKPTDSFVYEDVEVTLKDNSILKPSEGDAPMLTQMWPCPSIPSCSAQTCYTHIQDHELSTKSLSGGEQTMTSIAVPENPTILHVHDSLSITSIPRPASAFGSTWFSLEWCRVERCPNLGHVFSAPQLSFWEHNGSPVVPFIWLSTFWASELPKARYIWNWTPASVVKLPEDSFRPLELLHMDLCPRVIHVLPLHVSMVYDSLGHLETLEIVWCGDLREVFALYTTDAKSKQQQSTTTTVHLQVLKRIHLHELPKLQGICGRWRIYAPKLETVKIRGCWSLKHLPALSNKTIRKVECDCEKEWWDTLEWDGLDGKHDRCLYKPIHPRYYKKKLLRGSVLR